MAMNASRKRKVSEQVVPAFTPLLPSRHSTDRHSANPFDDADYPIPNFERVYRLMRDPASGLQVSDRRWRIRNYSKCFVGSEAVQWMIDNLEVDRDAAVSTGQRLMDAGIIHHVTHSEPFSDEYYFYRFQEDDDGNILNMKRVWDVTIPTRPAVDVAKDLLTRLALLCEEYRKRVLAVGSTPPLPSTAPGRASVSGTPNLDSYNRLSSSPSLFRSYSSPPIPLGTHSPILGTPVLGTTAPSTPVPTTKYAVGDDVDYSSLAKSAQFRLFALSSAELQRVQLVALNHHERIAFFVNVYNALCLHAHVVHGPPNSVLRRYVFFRALSYRVAGLDLTLDDIEHGILRGNKKPPMLKFIQQLRPSDPKCQHVLTKRDARIHFIISAGTRSDPPIRILDGDDVQEELHHATVEFLSYSVKLDVEKRCVTLPRIFYWYAEDFPTPENALLRWVAKYLPVEMSHQLVCMVESEDTVPSIVYENFDWANAEARFNASVVRRKRRKLDRQRSLSAHESDQSIEVGFHMPTDTAMDRFASRKSFSGISEELFLSVEGSASRRGMTTGAEENAGARQESDASIHSLEAASRKGADDGDKNSSAIDKGEIASNGKSLSDE